MAENGGRRRCRLVLIATPLQGHMTPMLQLGTYLHSKGFLITIAHAEFNRPDPSKHPDFIFLPFPDSLAGPGDFPSFMHFLLALNDNCRAHLQNHLFQIIKTQKDNGSVVIVHDSLMFFAGTVARDLGVPFIILDSCSAAFFSSAKIIPQLHKDGRFPVQDSLLQEIVPELDPFRYKDLPFLDLPIPAALQSVSMITPKPPPSAFIWNTVEFLEPSALTHIRQQYQVPIFTIGPLHKITATRSTSFLEEDTNCISWLDKQAPKSVIYVSIGSFVYIDEKISTEMAWGLANSNQPFIWVVRPGSVRGYEWVEFLPERLAAEMKGRGLIIKWAPQKQVLAHSAVGGFWSHCGWNSVLESVSEGVPMLCQPLGVDQLLNARYLCDVWKTGVEVAVEKGKIECAIRTILDSNANTEIKNRAVESKEKVQAAVTEGGSSQNSLNELVEFIFSL